MLTTGLLRLKLHLMLSRTASGVGSTLVLWLEPSMYIHMRMSEVRLVDPFRHRRLHKYAWRQKLVARMIQDFLSLRWCARGDMRSWSISYLRVSFNILCHIFHNGLSDIWDAADRSSSVSQTGGRDH